MVPEDENNISGNGPDPDEHSGSGGDGDIQNRKRKRIRVRKRIRIKKKPSAKKKVKKIAEKVFWALIIIGFVTSLIVMIVQLDIKDERYKQKQKTTRSKTSF